MRYRRCRDSTTPYECTEQLLLRANHRKAFKRHGNWKSRLTSPTDGDIHIHQPIGLLIT